MSSSSPTFKEEKLSGDGFDGGKAAPLNGREESVSLFAAGAPTTQFSVTDSRFVYAGHSQFDGEPDQGHEETLHRGLSSRQVSMIASACSVHITD